MSSAGSGRSTVRIRRFALAATAGVALAVGAGLLAPVPALAVTVPPTGTGTLVSADPADNTPHAQNGEVRAFAQIGDTVYAGGTFTGEKAAGATSWTARGYLFAYNRTSGALLTGFAPTLDGAVSALAVSPDGKLIAGGAFGTVNGVSRKNLVELDPATGATVAAWTGHADGGNVAALAVAGNNLYVGGAFHWMDGVQHSLLARLNASTGAIDPAFQIDASVPRAGSEYVWTLAVSPDGGTLVAGGNFTQVNGTAHNQVVMVTLAGTPAVANWTTNRFVPGCYNTSFVSYVTDIDFSDDGSYFVIGANGGRDTGGVGYCDAISRWETAARGATVDATWVDFTGTDSVTAINASAGAIYAGGHFRWVNNANGNDAQGPGGVDRLGIASLDPSNGLPLNWNPRRSAGSNLPAGGVAWDSDVPVLWRGTDGIYFGQNSDGMGDEYHGRMGLFPVSGGRTFTPGTANSGTPGYLYLRTGTNQLTKVAFNGTALGATSLSSQPNLTNIGAATTASDKLYWASSSGPLEFSQFTGGTAGGPWTTGYNAWYNASGLTGMAYLNGRLYYTRSGSNALYYRYFEPDGYILGCTEFALPTRNLTWTSVRGLAYVNGRLLYGSTDGSLRAVPFDPTAASGYAVDGASATVVAASAPGLAWSSSTLFYDTV
jgi:hypothetical protein